MGGSDFYKQLERKQRESQKLQRSVHVGGSLASTVKPGGQRNRPQATAK